MVNNRYGEDFISMKQAKFSIGQCVHHKLFVYRGVIIDVDPVFLGSDDWYEDIAKSRPPKDEPWYHVLVHDAQNETYVAERNLADDESREPVDHPLVDEFFDDFEQGVYHSDRPTN
jgi:heat shock protein HspQ